MVEKQTTFIFRFGWIIVLLLLHGNPVFSQSAGYAALVEKYILTYNEIAVKEMMVYRIPASITLAQGILESNAGTSKLAREANNHFGIKCHKEWLGRSYTQSDDARKECFRRYDDPLESFRDHSYFLTLRDRYRRLFELDVTDYRGWAKGLKAAGYATNPSYAEKLIAIIENYSLYKFDHANYATAFSDSLANIEDAKAREAWLAGFIVVAEGPNGRKIYENNRLKLTVALKGDNLFTIARDFKMNPNHLSDFNDLEGNTYLIPGQLVYLESKRRKATASVHLVKARETLYGISQMYGVKLRLLYKRNDIREGLEPAQGMLLKLR